MEIGVLDIQGSVEEHFAALERLAKSHGGAGKKTRAGRKFEVVLVKSPEDLEKISGLIIPGGESTTIGKLLRKFGLREKIIERVRGGMAVWGTCAGAILLAKKIVGRETADGLGLMGITVERNAYGRQIESFETQIEFNIESTGIKGGSSNTSGNLHDKSGWANDKEAHRKISIPAIFIRAPKILAAGKNVEILAKHGDEIVAARQDNMLVTNFHPELTDDLRVHEYFLKMCGAN